MRRELIFRILSEENIEMDKLNVATFIGTIWLDYNVDLSSLTKYYRRYAPLWITFDGDAIEGMKLLDAGVHALVIKSPNLAEEMISGGIPEDRFIIDFTTSTDKKYRNIIDFSVYSLKEAVPENFIKHLNTDKLGSDLIPTCIVNEFDQLLGLAYSSKESISLALKSGSGVYFSRTRNQLWHKGETSGDTQLLLRVEFDCDQDALKFIVRQLGSGFCHLKTTSCFGKSKGISKLVDTLKERIKSPISGSYTNKLLSDEKLLHAKIREEAEELIQAKEKDEIIWETADVLYFGLAKCVKHGIEISDLEAALDNRSLKVIRRPGLAKKEYEEPKEDSLAPFEIKKHVWSKLTNDQRTALLKRPIMKTKAIKEKVEPIIEEVRKRGDQALIEFCEKFDNVKIQNVFLKTPFDKNEMENIPKHVKESIDTAFKNIKKFHEAQLTDCSKEILVETMPGVKCSRFSKPIDNVGLYVPGGSAPLPSTALMLGIPAMIAGCENIIFATPPQSNGRICPELLYIAEKVGAYGILVSGGAQAIAALAYGTESVPKCYKVCGPGNQYVTSAKMIVQSDPEALVSLDMPAGPSEVLVIADKTSDVEFVASDLLSQAEHGPDSQVVLLTINWSEQKMHHFQEVLRQQATVLSRRNIIEQSLKNSFVIEFETVEDSIKFSNEYGPEHLILQLEKASEWRSKVKNAGSVFLGYYTPESCGDYASGTNHTLPTYGYAKMYSGVSVSTFTKFITSQEISEDGLKVISNIVMTLAEVEGLEGHKEAMIVGRGNKIDSIIKGLLNNKMTQDTDMMKLKVRLNCEGAKAPTRGSNKAAGYDLYSCEECLVPAQGKTIVKTGISIAVPEGTYGRVAPRSGLAVKHFIDVGAGVIDEDYRGEVGVVLFNFSKTDYVVQKGDRVAQLILERIMTPEVEVVQVSRIIEVEFKQLDETERGEGGFGSTGKK